MTRVSDKAEFAQAITEGGGLPFLAMALMREDEADALLKETKELAGGLPWGVGLLGFVSLELRKEQMAAIVPSRKQLHILWREHVLKIGNDDDAMIMCIQIHVGNEGKCNNIASVNEWVRLSNDAAFEARYDHQQRVGAICHS